MFRLIRSTAALSMLACASIALSGCDTINGAATAVDIANKPVCGFTSADERLSAGAELTYNILANAWLIARSNPAVPMAVRQKVYPLMIQLGQALHVERDAYAACDAASLPAKVKAITDLKASITLLIPKQVQSATVAITGSPNQ